MSLTKWAYSRGPRCALSVLTALAALAGCNRDDDACHAGSAANTVAALVPSGATVRCENSASFTLNGGKVRFAHVAYGALNDCASGCFTSHVCAIEDGEQTLMFSAFWNADDERPRSLNSDCPGLTSSDTRGCLTPGARHPLATDASFMEFARAEIGSGPFRWCFD